MKKQSASKPSTLDCLHHMFREYHSHLLPLVPDIRDFVIMKLLLILILHVINSI